MSNRVGIVVGSRSDIAAAEKAAAVLDELGVGNEIRVISAHRAPDLLRRWVASADERGIGVVSRSPGSPRICPAWSRRRRRCR